MRAGFTDENMALDSRERFGYIQHKQMEVIIERYLVISAHREEECKNALGQVPAMDYITHFEWGCMDGEQTGWAIPEGESAKEAMMAVPCAERHSASIVKFTRFPPADIEKMHVK